MYDVMLRIQVCNLKFVTLLLILYSMNYKEITASSALSSHIKCFWYTERRFMDDDAPFEVLPDSYAELIFFSGANCALNKTNGKSITLSSPFIVGLLDKPIYLKIKGHVRIVAVRFYPWSIFSFLQISPQTNENICLVNHSFSQLSQILQSIIAAGDSSVALQFLQDYFFTRLTNTNTSDTLLENAGKLIVASNGTLPVSQIADESRMTVRTLERNMKRKSGTTVKALARKTRFEKVRDYIWFHPHCNFTQLAYEFDFTDQSHFNREFRNFSNKTPNQFAKEAIAAKIFLSKNNVVFVQVEQ